MPRARMKHPYQGGMPGVAVVVGGAVAKGAFAAGALSYVTLRLRAERIPIRALVGTSSGALNATVIAAGVRSGKTVTAAKELVRLWRDRAAAWSLLDLDPMSAIRLAGVSGPERVTKLLEEACTRAGAGSGREPVSLRLVVAPLAGSGTPTSFEAVERFHDADLDEPWRRARMLRAAVASAAFPFAFKPVAVDGDGPCIDGGVVNNTPIAEAIERDPDIGTVFVIVAEPADVSLPVARATALHGIHLGTRVLEMLVHERLVRDLAEARAVNAWLGTLDRLEAEGRLDRGTRDEVIEGLYHRDAARFRKLELVEIRPRAALEGGAFDGFFRPALRRAYLRAGWEAARAAWQARGAAGLGPFLHRRRPAKGRVGASLSGAVTRTVRRGRRTRP